ncbi:MAG: hypothetical protein V4543_00320 [Bacteroidota bacterium]
MLPFFRASLCIFAALLFCVSFSANAQLHNLHHHPDTFITDLSRLVKSSKLAVAEKSADDFTNVWGSLTEEQKKLFMKGARTMALRKLPPHPFFEMLLNSSVAAINNKKLEPKALEQLFNVNNRVAGSYTPDQMKQWFGTIYTLCDKDMLYQNKFNSLKANAENISFYFDGEQAQDDTTPAPPKPDYFGKDPVLASDTNGTYVEENPQIPPKPQLADVHGAVIIFGKADLNFENNYDTTAIEGTRGVYVSESGLFLGKGGRFDWRTAGFGPEVYSELGKYQFKVNVFEFSFDHSTLHFPDRLSAPMLGNMEFKSVKHRGPSTSTWPRFTGYLNTNRLKGLPENISISGGFSMVGYKINTETYYASPSVFFLKNRDKPLMRWEGNRLDISGDTLYSAPEASSVIYLKEDTIFQPGGRLVYSTGKNKVNLFKDKGRFRETPFLTPWHALEITCDEMRWSIDSGYIDFVINSAAQHVPAMFESTDYFNKSLYSTTSGMWRFNAITILMRHFIQTGEPIMYTGSLSTEYKIKESELKQSVLVLANLGFVEYTPEKGRIVIKEKLKHYYSSKNHKKDYDFVSIPSLTGRDVNARLNVVSKDLTINGVEKFSLSDSLGVFIKPYDKSLTVTKNRDFIFNGFIHAGSFDIHGRSFKFDYNKFKIDLQQIDSINLKIEPKKTKKGKKGKEQVQKGESVKLEGKRHHDGASTDSSGKGTPTSGVLYINKPDNKSNRLKFPEYPVLDVENKSFVYFDSPRILKGAYNQNVYFKVPPFNADSLASTDLKTISFAGTFVSDSIFPSFKESLRLQKDLSLGFKHAAPAEGYKIYNGPGKFFGNISLDNKGIRGKGEIHYLSTVVKSEDFIFYQDSVVTDGKTFVMEATDTANGKYPDAQAENYHMLWKVKEDSMIISNGPESPITLYQKSTTLNGRIVVGPRKVTGGGDVKRQGSVVSSQQLTFEKENFSGREANFKIESEDTLKPAVACTNVKFVYDLKKRFAEMTPEVSGFASNAFPYAQYKTSIPKAIWDFDKKIVTMSKPDSIDIAESYFYSTLPEQDSLNFSATEAIYNIEDHTLTIKGIPYILCADARITPDSGIVHIQENANMLPLMKAHIEVDTLNKYHYLTDGNIKINSLHDFVGDALYRYVNSDNDTLSIRFDSFSQETDEKNREADKYLDKEREKVLADYDEKIKNMASPDSAIAPVPPLEIPPDAPDDVRAKLEAKHEKALEKQQKEKLRLVEEKEKLVSERIDAKRKLGKNWGNYFTQSGGEVPETQPLRLTPGILFKGGVIMNARKANLEFKGMVTLDTKKNTNQAWITYVNKDERNFSVNTEGATDASGQLLTSGLFIEDGENNMYSVFVNTKKNPTDVALFTSTGLLSFTPETKVFKVGSAEKMKGTTYEGNIFSYNDSTSRVGYEGKFTMLRQGPKPDEDYILNTAGSGEGNSDSANYTLGAMMQFISSIPANSWKAMEATAKDRVKTLQPQPANEDLTAVLFRIADIAGNRSARDYEIRSKVNYSPIAETVGKLARGIVMSDVNLRWSAKQNAWYSVGKIGVANINRTDLNAKVTGAIEVRKGLQGDFVNIYLEFSQDGWFYFGYDDSKKLLVSSSDDKFMAEIKKSSKANITRAGTYCFAPAEGGEKGTFLKDYFKNYFDQDYVDTEPVPQQPAGIDASATSTDTEDKDKKKKQDAPPTPEEPNADAADELFPLSEEERKAAAAEKKAKADAEKAKQAEEKRKKDEVAAEKKAADEAANGLDPLLGDPVATPAAAPADSAAKAAADSLKKTGADSLGTNPAVVKPAADPAAAAAEAEKKKAEARKLKEAEDKKRKEEADKKKKEEEESGGF